jgi:glycosyltransferase involved in cell wall biosynthesis
LQTVIAYPGNMSHAQHIARAMFEAEALKAFVTTYVYQSDGLFASLLNAIPAGIFKQAAQQLERRSVVEIPPQYVHCYPTWEVLRTGAQKAGASPAVVDALWDIASHSFDSTVARHHVPGADAIQSFEYTALASFRRAKEEGVARILHVPSLDSAQLNDILRRERKEWEDLASEHDSYFDRRFPRRQERRRQEITLADVIVANSSLTARSHIAAGADPAKTFVALLGAPPPIAEIKIAADGRRTPLRVLYAGPFSLRKGAHYLLGAWQILNAGSAASLSVYGRMELPALAVASRLEGIVFHGSVPRSTLFSAYEAADVLVFPTLSDGFGLVVAEALAHGLPVITTDQAGAADLVTSDNGFVVPAANSDALADALRWCLDNRERLQCMRLKAVEAARRRQWSDFRRDLIDVLDSGLRRKGYSPAFQRPEQLNASC